MSGWVRAIAVGMLVAVSIGCLVLAAFAAFFFGQFRVDPGHCPYDTPGSVLSAADDLGIAWETIQVDQRRTLWPIGQVCRFSLKDSEGERVELGAVSTTDWTATTIAYPAVAASATAFVMSIAVARMRVSPRADGR